MKKKNTILKEKEHVYIPKNTIHRIENIGKEELVFIEIQLGEDLKKKILLDLRMIMEESKFFNFEKAPYLELDDYKAPEGINSYFVPMDDGVRLRVCHWRMI